MTNRPNGTLYVGTTTDLIRRALEHKESIVESFTKKYCLTRLVYFERHETLPLARQREMNIKHWSRAWKVRLIPDFNRAWADLYESLL